MNSTIVTVAFEYTDAHMSIVYDGSYIDELETKSKKLCEVFEFEYKAFYKRIDDTPNWTFHISFP